MSNIFIKRVSKLIDGTPVIGYSESRKPIRAPRKTRKEVPSEFELHSQVLHNTWGRIEFEIEPLNQMRRTLTLLAQGHPELKSKPPEDRIKKKDTHQALRKIDSLNKLRQKLSADPDLAPCLKPEMAPKSPERPKRNPVHALLLQAIRTQELRTLIEQRKQAQPDQYADLDSVDISIKKEVSTNDENSDNLKKQSPKEAVKTSVEIPSLPTTKVDLTEKTQTLKQNFSATFICKDIAKVNAFKTKRKEQINESKAEGVFGKLAKRLLNMFAKS